MTNRCIANEMMTGVPRDYLLSLVSECAKSLRYHAVPIFPDDKHLPAKIAIFAMDRREENYGSMAHAGTILATPIPPNMRIQVFCQVWQSSIDFDPGFTPCEVAAEITRYLLRMLEGHVRANEWRPPWETGDELSELLRPIVLKMTVSTLEKQVNDFITDNNLTAGFLQLKASGTIQVTQEWAGGLQGALIGFDGERLAGDNIRLTPYLNDTARAYPAAIEDLRLWREVLEAAAGIMPPKSKRKSADGHFSYIPEKRAAIVQHFNEERGHIKNIDAWAQSKYQISGRTLKRYRDEFEPQADT